MFHTRKCNKTTSAIHLLIIHLIFINFPKSEFSILELKVWCDLLHKCWSYLVNPSLSFPPFGKQSFKTFLQIQILTNKTISYTHFEIKIQKIDIFKSFNYSLLLDFLNYSFQNYHFLTFSNYPCPISSIVKRKFVKQNII